MRRQSVPRYHVFTREDVRAERSAGKGEACHEQKLLVHNAAPFFLLVRCPLMTFSPGAQNPSRMATTPDEILVIIFSFVSTADRYDHPPPS